MVSKVGVVKNIRGRRESWQCDLIIYWFYCTAEDMRGSDAGRQYCFLAGLKSVVDKDGGEILVSS